MSARYAFYAGMELLICFWSAVVFVGTGHSPFLFLCGFSAGAAFTIAALGLREAMQ